MQLHHRHLDEAEFSLGVFDAALDAPHYTLASVAAGPERRLWAHVDALIMAGPDRCGQLLLPVLADADEEPDRVAAATLILAELATFSARLGAQPDPLALLRAPVDGPAQELIWTRMLGLHDASADPLIRAAIRRGASLGASEPFTAWVLAQLDERKGLALAGCLELLTEQRCVSERLADFLDDDEPAVVRAAAQAASLSREPRLLEGLIALARSSDPTVCRAAIQSALVHYIPGAWASALYWAFTDAPSPFRRRALVWVAILGDAEVHGWLIQQLAREERRADALWALSFCGRVAAVDAALEWLEDERFGPLAAEVVTGISGLPLDHPGCWLRRSEPNAEQSLPPLAHDALEGDLVPGAEDALPIPHAAGIRQWWSQQRERLDPRRRHLMGYLLHPPVLVAVLRGGPMRRRHVLGLELTIRSAGQLQLRTRQTTSRQLHDLEALPSLELLDLQRGLRGK